MTVRKQIADLLLLREWNAREISQQIGVSEKDVYHHLKHVAQSLGAAKKKLRIAPADCGFVFKERRKVEKPGRCPKCKGQQIRSPRFSAV